MHGVIACFLRVASAISALKPKSEPPTNERGPRIGHSGYNVKGPYLQGVKVVIAESYERIHRSNLIGMGILPLQFKYGETTQSI